MADLAVIMSVYKNDRLTFLQESVQSILDQTFTQFDFFIVFDGPVSLEIEQYIAAQTDTRIKLYRLEKNGGLAGALNYLLEIILKDPEYKLIARMDADDISIPARFEKQYHFLSENPEISITGSWYQEIDEEGNHLADRRLPVEHAALIKRYYVSTPFAHPSVMYRRSLIETAGFYPANTILMEDNVLWGNALLKGLKFANIPEYLLKFRIDRNFFRRRSGILYGWNFIVTKFSINKMLNSPGHTYVFLLGIGILKMLPGFFLKYFYPLHRKLSHKL
jgi:glycosyltransferase involved in cell wall biosynthesis